MALDVATAASSGQGQHEYWEGQDYDGVCKLLRSEGSTAPHRHHVSVHVHARMVNYIIDPLPSLLCHNDVLVGGVGIN